MSIITMCVLGPTDLKRRYFFVTRTLARDRPSPYDERRFFHRSAGACPPRALDCACMHDGEGNPLACACGIRGPKPYDEGWRFFRERLPNCIETRRSLLPGGVETERALLPAILHFFTVYETLSVIPKCAVHECLAKKRSFRVSTQAKNQMAMSVL